jgi:hypothetical protein
MIHLRSAIIGKKLEYIYPFGRDYGNFLIMLTLPYSKYSSLDATIFGKLGSEATIDPPIQEASRLS